MKTAYQNAILTQRDPLQLADSVVLDAATPFSQSIRLASLNLNSNTAALKTVPRSGLLPRVVGYEEGDETAPPESLLKEVSETSPSDSGNPSSGNPQISKRDADLALVAQKAFEAPDKRGDTEFEEAGYSYDPRLSDKETAVYRRGNELVVGIKGQDKSDSIYTGMAASTIGITKTDRYGKDRKFVERLLQENPNLSVTVVGNDLGGTVTDAVVRDLASNPTYRQRISGVAFNPSTGYNTQKCIGPQCGNIRYMKVDGATTAALRQNADTIQGACAGESLNSISQFTGKGKCAQTGSTITRGLERAGAAVIQAAPDVAETAVVAGLQAVAPGVGPTAYYAAKGVARNVYKASRGDPGIETEDFVRAGVSYVSNKAAQYAQQAAQKYMRDPSLSPAQQRLQMRNQSRSAAERRLKQQEDMNDPFRRKSKGSRTKKGNRRYPTSLPPPVPGGDYDPGLVHHLHQLWANDSQASDATLRQYRKQYPQEFEIFWGQRARTRGLPGPPLPPRPPATTPLSPAGSVVSLSDPRYEGMSDKAKGKQPLQWSDRTMNRRSRSLPPQKPPKINTSSSMTLRPRDDQGRAITSSKIPKTPRRGSSGGGGAAPQLPSPSVNPWATTPVQQAMPTPPPRRRSFGGSPTNPWATPTDPFKNATWENVVSPPVGTRRSSRGSVGAPSPSRRGSITLPSDPPTAAPSRRSSLGDNDVFATPLTSRRPSVTGAEEVFATPRSGSSRRSSFNLSSPASPWQDQSPPSNLASGSVSPLITDTPINERRKVIESVINSFKSDQRRSQEWEATVDELTAAAQSPNSEEALNRRYQIELLKDYMNIAKQAKNAKTLEEFMGYKNMLDQREAEVPYLKELFERRKNQLSPVQDGAGPSSRRSSRRSSASSLPDFMGSGPSSPSSPPGGGGGGPSAPPGGGPPSPPGGGGGSPNLSDDGRPWVDPKNLTTADKIRQWLNSNINKMGTAKQKGEARRQVNRLLTVEKPRTRSQVDKLKKMVSRYHELIDNIKLRKK